jgi:hypothetical protein
MVNCPLAYFTSHGLRMPSGMSKYVCGIIILLHSLTHRAVYPNQSEIPEGGKPLCLILYADKTKLSSFGTAKGYPVIARCANLPAEIRNGNGFGGGRVVGWLPIVRFSLSLTPGQYELLLRSLRTRKKKKRKHSLISNARSGTARSSLCSSR